MKKSMFFVLLASFLSFSAAAEDVPPKPQPHQPRQHHMQPPVYATQPISSVAQTTGKNPETREKMDAARRRRFEIMVLVSAYKIMPDKDRMPLRAELLKRIEEDFQATIALQKGRIAQAEKDLIMLRAELADREARSEELIERELERLINLPPPGRSRRGMPIRNSNTPGPQSQEMDRNLQDKMN